MATIADFPVGTTKKFTITCKLDGVAQDITGDTLTLVIKTNYSPDVADAAAILTKTADVATDGANGNALFTLDPDDTKVVTPGHYFMDVKWNIFDGSEYIAHSQPIELQRRVSDPSA